MANTKVGIPGGRLPVIQQSELTECGLACLAMIAIFHGHDVDLASMRRRFPVSVKGTGLSRMMGIADKLGFAARPIRVDLDYLDQLQSPCILHWDLTHFVVLKKVKKNRVVIHDPARGAVTMDIQEFGRHFTGVVLELNPSYAFVPTVERTRLSLKALAGKIKGLKSAVTQLFILALSLEVFTLALPLMMQLVLDYVLLSSDLALLVLVGSCFATLVIIQAGISVMRGRLVADLGATINAQFIGNLFGHLLRLPLAFFERRSVGGVLSRFLSVQSVQQTLTGSFIEGVLDSLTVVLALVLLILYSPLASAVVFSAFVLYAILRFASFRHLRSLREEQLAFVARQQSLMIESISGIHTVKLGDREPERHAGLVNATLDVAMREAGINRVAANFSSLSKLIFGLQRVFLVSLCAWLVMQGKFSAGALVVVVAYSEILAFRGGSLIDKCIELKLIGMHTDRIADIALEAPEANVSGSYSGPLPTARIDVEGVGFRYSEDDPWVLRDCSFSIEAEECVAIVGASGCGKTTLAKLITGLLRPTEGRILMGGVDIQHLGLAKYRQHLSAVMQNDVLFAGSIADNISFFDVDGNVKAIHAAAEVAQIHEEIVSMPMGYETLVGDMGSSLSGGQKQRVLLARALYREPKVLLLDEATSHLDVEKERAINECIRSMSATRIVIAHRPETIRSADRAIEMKQGRIG